MFNKLDRAVRKVSYIFLLIACFVILAMMGLTVADVIGRYFFMHPLTGSQDVSEILMILLVYAAMSYMIRDRAYIRADLISGKLSKKTMAILNGCCMIVVLWVAVLWCVQTAIDFFTTINTAVVTTTILIPIPPFFAFIAIMLLVTSLEIVLDIFRYFREFKEGKGQKISEPEELDRLTIE